MTLAIRTYTSLPHNHFLHYSGGGGGFFPLVPSVERQEKCSLQNPNDQQIVVKTILYISGVIYGCLDVCSSDLRGPRPKIGP